MKTICAKVKGSYEKNKEFKIKNIEKLNKKFINIIFKRVF
jgi:hypothetical protein